MKILAPTCLGECKVPSTNTADVVHSVHLDPRQPWWWSQRVILHDHLRCEDAQRSTALLRRYVAEHDGPPTAAELAAASATEIRVRMPRFTGKDHG